MHDEHRIHIDRDGVFGPEVLLAVDAACRHAGACTHVAGRAEGAVALAFDGAALAAVVEAASGFGAGASGAWADGVLADAPAHCATGLAAVLAVGAEAFDAVLDAAVDGPVWFHTN